MSATIGDLMYSRLGSGGSLWEIHEVSVGPDSIPTVIRVRAFNESQAISRASVCLRRDFSHRGVVVFCIGSGEMEGTRVSAL